MALLLVLVIVALLTSLLTELSFSTMVDMHLTGTFRDSTRQYRHDFPAGAGQSLDRGS